MRLPFYIGRRVLFLVPQVSLISFITFALVRLLPGDPARLSLGPLAPEEAVEALRRKLHLDLSIPQQYLIWLSKALSGDFGTSWSQGTEVGDDLLHRIPVTLELIFLSLLVVFLVLVPLAIITASRTRNSAVRVLRNVTFGYGMLAGALPDFLLGLAAYLRILYPSRPAARPGGSARHPRYRATLRHRIDPDRHAARRRLGARSGLAPGIW